MRPVVQISLDLTNIDESLETAAMAMRAGVDWLEAGTPLILAEGLHGVKKLRESFPGVPIVADLKTMDGGYLRSRNDGESRRDACGGYGKSARRNDKMCGRSRKRFWNKSNG